LIKAKYIGVDTGVLQSGKVYEIKTKCVSMGAGAPRLEVSFGERFRYCVWYRDLEIFLKFWKVVGVYGQSRTKKSKKGRGKERKEV